MTHYITKNDLQKSERHHEINIKIAELQKQLAMFVDDYNQGKITEDEVLRVKDEIEAVMKEWRETLVVLKKS